MTNTYLVFWFKRSITNKLAVGLSTPQYNADAAREHESADRLVDSLEKWAEIFGDEFPSYD